MARQRRAGGGVDQLPSGRYRVRIVTTDGRRVSLGTFPTKRAAEACYARTLTEQSDGKVVAPRRRGTTLGEYAPRWVETRLTSKGEPLRQRVRELYAKQLERAMAAIRKAHRVAEMEPPSTEAARAILKTARQDAADAGRRVDKAPALSVADLRRIVAALDTGTLVGLRDRALLVLGFAACLRRSELVGLDVTDVQECPEGLCIVVRRSKTDRMAEGRDVAVPYGSHHLTCPIRAVQEWIAASGIESGPLFPGIDRHGVIGRAPSGRGSDDGRLTRQAVSIILKRAAAAAGIEGAEDLSGHSLRRGLATEARRAGADFLTIGRHGGWVDGSRALMGYMAEVDRWEDNPVAKVGL